MHSELHGCHRGGHALRKVQTPCAGVPSRSHGVPGLHLRVCHHRREPLRRRIDGTMEGEGRHLFDRTDPHRRPERAVTRARHLVAIASPGLIGAATWVAVRRVPQAPATTPAGGSAAPAAAAPATRRAGRFPRVASGESRITSRPVPGSKECVRSRWPPCRGGCPGTRPGGLFPPAARKHRHGHRRGLPGRRASTNAGLLPELPPAGDQHRRPGGGLLPPQNLRAGGASGIQDDRRRLARRRPGPAALVPPPLHGVWVHPLPTRGRDRRRAPGSRGWEENWSAACRGLRQRMVSSRTSISSPIPRSSFVHLSSRHLVVVRLPAHSRTGMRLVTVHPPGKTARAHRGKQGGSDSWEPRYCRRGVRRPARSSPARFMRRRQADVQRVSQEPRLRTDSERRGWQCCAGRSPSPRTSPPKSPCIPVPAEPRIPA